MFIRSLAMLLTITSPVCVLLAGLAGPLVDVLYGARWHPAAAALVLLAGLGLFRVAHELAYDFLVALGKSRAVLGIQLLWLAVLIPCLTLAAHVGGIRGVGTGHLVVAFCVVGAAYLVALRSVRVNLRELARHQVRPLLAAGLGGVSAYAAARVLPGDLIRLVVGGTVGFAVYAAVAYPLLRSMVALARPGSARHLGAHRGPTRSAVLAAARVLLPARARAGAR